MNTITFDKSSRKFILETFGKKRNKEGYVVDKESGVRVVASDGDSIKASELASITRGKEGLEFHRNGIISLIALHDKISNSSERE